MLAEALEFALTELFGPTVDDALEPRPAPPPADGFSRLISESLPDDHHVNGLFRLLQGQVYNADEITTVKKYDAKIST